jgi:hypothetical protein
MASVHFSPMIAKAQSLQMWQVWHWHLPFWF